MAVKILVVEDDDVFRESIERLLGQDYTIQFADTLGAARTSIQLSKPDCVLLDFRLPDGEGTLLIPELVEQQLPVVVCTARGSEALAVKALQVGADDYLTKSDLRESDLSRAVQNALERSRLRRTVREREAEKDALIEQLQTALNDIETLRGLVPICAECKKIRDDEGFWHVVEAYISQHTQADFTHSYCPDCYQREVDRITESS